MNAYNSTHFDPPAPLASVTLRHYSDNRSIDDVLMLIDTGADVSLIRQDAVNRLGLTILADSPYELTGFDGAISHAFAVQSRLAFCNRTFRGRFLLIDQPIGVIGRDILNLLPLLFDGPNQVWSEYRSNQ